MNQVSCNKSYLQPILTKENLFSTIFFNIHVNIVSLQNLALHPLANTFTQFSFMSIYQLTFFILFTTIGLNVIFGIIVDTFSELRDLKVSRVSPLQL